MNDGAWTDFVMLVILTLACVVLMQLSGVGSIALMNGLRAACAVVGVFATINEARRWLSWE